MVLSLMGAADTEGSTIISSTLSVRYSGYFSLEGTCSTSIAELLDRGALAARDLLRRSAIIAICTGLSTLEAIISRFSWYRKRIPGYQRYSKDMGM